MIKQLALIAFLLAFWGCIGSKIKRTSSKKAHCNFGYWVIYYIDTIGYYERGKKLIQPSKCFPDLVYFPNLDTSVSNCIIDLIVWNRQGELMFESNDFSQKWIRRDSCQSIKEGTYFYSLNTINKEDTFNRKVYNGSVTIVK